MEMSNQIERSSSDDSYSIFDRMDEQQIINADKAVKQKMIYQYKGKEELTYSGVKCIVLEMSRHGEILEIEESNVTLDKDVEEDQKYWFWRARVKLRNAKTGYPSEGLQECRYLGDDGNYNPFGRNIAHSKAERNAQRKQIPEQRIIELLKLAKEQGSVQSVDEPAKSQAENLLCTCEKQEFNPNKDLTQCLHCNGRINEFKKKIMGLSKDGQEKIV